jgi:hypothetical protein
MEIIMKNKASKMILWIVITISTYVVSKSITDGYISDPSQQTNANYMALIITALIVGGTYLISRFFRKG